MAEFKYLFKKRHYFASVFFIVVFSILFLEIYHPFSVTLWLGLGKGRVIPTLSFYACVIFLLISSKVILSYVGNRIQITLKRFIIHTVIEFASIAMVYLVFASRTTEVNLYLVMRTMFCVALILAIPYIIYFLYAAFMEKNEELDLLRLQVKEMQDQTSAKILNLSDSGGTLRLSIDERSICYVESQDNYVNIRYELNGEIASYMLRCSTIRFEGMIAGTCIKRCHRSYFVNTSRIRSIRYESRRTMALLDMPKAKEVPISKTYQQAFESLFQTM